MNLKKQLHSLTKGNKTLKSYLTNVKALFAQLAESGYTVSADEKKQAICNGLNQSYDPIVTALTTVEGMDIGTFYSHLLTFGMRLEQHLALLQPSLANVAMTSTAASGNMQDQRRFIGQGSQYQQNRNRSFRRGNNNSFQRNNQQQPRNETGPKCQICKKINHLADRCWFRYEKPNNNQQRQLVAYIALPEGQLDNQWVTDTGATHHLTADMRNLTIPHEYDGTEQVQVVMQKIVKMNNNSSSNNLMMSANSSPLMNTSFMSNTSSNSSCITGITTDNIMFFEQEEEDYFYSSTTTSTTTDANLLPYFSYSSTNDYYGDEPTMFSTHSSVAPNDGFMNSGFEDYEFNNTTAPASTYHYPKRQRISNQHLSSTTTTTTTFHAENSISFVNNGAMYYPNSSSNFNYPSCSHYDHQFPKQSFLLPSVTPSTTSNAGQNYSCGDYNGMSSTNAKKSKSGYLSSQSVAARERRRKISEKTQQLGKLIPGGSKMNTAEMFHAAYKYIKFLRAQIGVLEFMGSIQENNKMDCLSPVLEVLLRSIKVQEKLYLEEMCLVSKELFDTCAAQTYISS
ncbi:uncharacterized protein LOC113290594 [Papaver somniferum]|uniref:uncharacterized protein LOC113290594 n=1 Tax=Papaver somniferum TaxID=3469 RepID=UPI000E700FAE|nr:uncharacterized protein LOC113290594 [Papaver somniferum]